MNSMLTIAIEKSDIKLVQESIENGADVNYIDSHDDGSSVLMKAVLYGDIDIIAFLIERGSDVNYQDENSETALMMAAMIRSTGNEYKGEEIIKKLIDNGADIKCKNRWGESAIIKLLVESDTNIKKDTALIIAASYGHLDIVKYLIDAGANDKYRNKYGRTASMEAERQHHYDIVKAIDMTE